MKVTIFNKNSEHYDRHSITIYYDNGISEPTDKEVKQQILDDGKKAEKYDALGNIIQQVNELLLENQQLKATLKTQ